MLAVAVGPVTVSFPPEKSIIAAVGIQTACEPAPRPGPNPARSRRRGGRMERRERLRRSSIPAFPRARTRSELPTFQGRRWAGGGPPGAGHSL